MLLGRAVLGAKVQLEGAPQAVGCVGVHAGENRAVMGVGKRYAHLPAAPKRKLTSVAAGQCLFGAPRRNRTADTILTMESSPVLPSPTGQHAAPLCHTSPQTKRLAARWCVM
jgi:hypothetical protein